MSYISEPEKKISDPSDICKEGRNNNNKKKFVSLLFLGQTGVGKTTLVYSIRDFLQNKPFEEIQTTQKEECLDVEFVDTPGQSRTRKPCSIRIKENEFYDVNLIDAPGIADTYGVENEERNWRELEKFIQWLELSAVVLVLNNTNNRATEGLKYVVNQLSQYYYTLFRDNFIIAITNVGNRPSAQTLATITTLGLSKEKIVYVDNEAYDEQVSIEDDEVDSSDEDGKKKFEKNKKQFRKLLEMASEFTPFRGNLLINYRTRREKLMTKLAKCNEDIICIKGGIKELQRIKQQLTSLPDRKVTIILGTFNKVSKWIQISDQVQLYCLQCKESCHDICQEDAFMPNSTNVDQHILLRPTSRQILYKHSLKFGASAINYGCTWIGMGVGAMVGEAPGLFAGGFVGGAVGEKIAKGLQEKADGICVCSKCKHVPQDHSFLKQFPKMPAIERTLKDRETVQEALLFLNKQKEELIQKQKKLEQKLDDKENRPILF